MHTKYAIHPTKNMKYCAYFSHRVHSNGERHHIMLDPIPPADPNMFKIDSQKTPQKFPDNFRGKGSANNIQLHSHYAESEREVVRGQQAESGDRVITRLHAMHNVYTAPPHHNIPITYCQQRQHLSHRTRLSRRLES